MVTFVIVRHGYCIFNKEKRKPIHTNLNALNTMLLGGLWHGASWNFMIWGGLNGLGIIVYKFWKNWNVYVRTLLLLFLTLLLAELALIFEKPVFNMFFVWSAILFLGTFLRMIYNLLGGKKSLKPLETCWAVFQTFIFITFTRLFFRSGSNLDPAEANETAWNTAKNMVNQIGSSWDFSLIPQIVMEYRNVFLLIVLGMIIHWLPDNFKRYYRICFTKMPLYIMAIVVVVAVFVIYQFVTADLQKFIYFQF